MLLFIRTNYHPGDHIDVTCTQGVISGEIEYVNQNYIVLRLSDGKICGIAASDIQTFKAGQPAEPQADFTPVTVPPYYRKPAPDAPYAAKRRPAPAAEPAPAPELPRAEDPQTGEPITIGEPKIVGKIDLERLQQIDPRLNRRRYFEKPGATAAPQNPEDTTENGEQPEGGSGFVPAKGRVTFYHADKHYGFIHDSQTEQDLYFHAQQVADNRLFDELRKGTKVVYTTDRNAQGYVAQAIHLPGYADKLLRLAESHLDMRRPRTAEQIARHVLEANPDNQEAKSLLEQIHDMSAPQHVTARNFAAPLEPFNLYPTYAEAKKAYLNKDFEQAEKLYLKAIQEDEKPTSCVKDLLTLYISRCKQADTEEKKQEILQKANAFFQEKRSLLPDNLTTKQFLALNYFQPMQDYEHFLLTVDDILTNSTEELTPSRKVFYLWQKAIALNKTGKPGEALDAIGEGLELAPRNRQLLSLREQILNPDTESGDTAEADNATQAAE